MVVEIKKRLNGEERRQRRGKTEAVAEPSCKGGLVVSSEATDAFCDAYEERDLEKVVATKSVLTALLQKAHDEVTAGATA